MDIYSLQLLNNVIRPTLEHIGVANAETKAWLLLGTTTVATASPAVQPGSDCYGMFALTSANHVKIWDEILATDADLASTVRGLASQHRFLQQPDAELDTNLAYATAIAAMVYEEAIAVWPTTNNPAALAELWTQGFWPHTDRNAGKFFAALAPLQQQGGLANAA